MKSFSPFGSFFWRACFLFMKEPRSSTRVRACFVGLATLATRPPSRPALGCPVDLSFVRPLDFFCAAVHAPALAFGQTPSHLVAGTRLLPDGSASDSSDGLNDRWLAGLAGSDSRHHLPKELADFFGTGLCAESQSGGSGRRWHGGGSDHLASGHDRLCPPQTGPLRKKILAVLALRRWDLGAFICDRRILRGGRDASATRSRHCLRCSGSGSSSRVPAGRGNCRRTKRGDRRRGEVRFHKGLFDR